MYTKPEPISMLLILYYLLFFPEFPIIFTHYNVFVCYACILFHSQEV